MTNTTTTLPIPLEFRLPEQWRPVPPDEAGAPGAAFVALIPEPDDGFTANVTVDGEYRPETAALAGLADSSVAALGAATGGAVTVLDRAEVGGPDVPGLTQTLRVAAPVSGGELQREVVQAQVYLSLPDTGNPARRAVVRLVLTATAAQLPSVLPDFRWFVSTVRPRSAHPGGVSRP